MVGYSKHLSLIVFAILMWGPDLRSAMTSPRSEKLYDLVITNARVVDGSGNPWFRDDIGIKDGRIAKIGRIAPEQGAKNLDVANQIVAPGFLNWRS